MTLLSSSRSPSRHKFVNAGEELLAIHLSELGLEYVREYRFCPPRRWRLDFWLPLYDLAIEVEGGSWTNGRHTRGAGFEADMNKYNTLTKLGGRLLRFTPGMVLSGEAKAWIEEVTHG